MAEKAKELVCSACGAAWPYGEPRPGWVCKKCRIEANPLTRERCLEAFKKGETITDGTFFYNMLADTGKIYGLCFNGTCDMDSNDFEYWMRHHFDAKEMEIEQ